MRFSSACLAALVATCLANSAAATVLMDEPFNYSNGGLVANSSGVWTAFSGGSTFVQVNNGAVVGLSHGSGSPSREDVVRDFNPAIPANVASGNIYLGFSFTVTTAPTAASAFFAGLAPTGNVTELRGLIFLEAPATPSTGGFRLGLENDGITASSHTGLLAANTPYYALLGIDAATNLSRLWVGTNKNTFVESAPTLVDSVAVDLVASLGRVFLRQASSITVPNAMTVDNVTVATTFSDIVTAIPESPASLLCGLALAMSSAGLAAASRRRRRK